MKVKDQRISEVKDYFEKTHIYLGKDQFNAPIQLRAQIILGMMQNEKVKSIIDVPSGNGIISIPHLEYVEQLTMVDIAEGMINLAKQNVPEIHRSKVTFINGDIFEIDFKGQTYDALFAIGILAHVPSPIGFVSEASKLIKKNGVLILQNTDTSHFFIRALKMLRGQKDLIQKNSYKLNSIAHKDLVKDVCNLGYELECCYRYQAGIPLVSRFLSKKGQIKLVQAVFGKPFNNRFAFFGSKCIYKFRKIGS